MVTDQDDVSIRQERVVWSLEATSCTCLHVAPGHFEMQIVANGAVIEREDFSDHYTASAFALARMRVYLGV